jgi:hypothetical protein
MTAMTSVEDLASELRHASISTTSDLYTNVLPKVARDGCGEDGVDHPSGVGSSSRARLGRGRAGFCRPSGALLRGGSGDRVDFWRSSQAGGGRNDFYNGSISDVRAYHRVITSTDIGQLYGGNPVTGPYPGTSPLSATSAGRALGGYTSPDALLNRTLLCEPNLRTVIVAPGTDDVLAGQSITTIEGELTNLIHPSAHLVDAAPHPSACSAGRPGFARPGVRRRRVERLSGPGSGMWEQIGSRHLRSTVVNWPQRWLIGVP